MESIAIDSTRTDVGTTGAKEDFSVIDNSPGYLQGSITAADAVTINRGEIFSKSARAER